VQARLLDDDEKVEVWPRLTAIWPAYDDYVTSSGRNIRVFHLTRGAPPPWTPETQPLNPNRPTPDR